MNILHMKYAAEVAKEGLLSKAAQKLLIAQPNISRAIKELEADLGIIIFDRSAKGMILTPQGEKFINYAKGILKQIYHVEKIYKEINSQRAIHNMLNHDYKLGIVRYAENYDKYFKAMLDEKGFNYELVTEFSYYLMMSRDNPLSQKEKINFEDLQGYIEVAHADPYVPSLPVAKVIKEEIPDNIERRIFVFERASQFDILCEN